MIALAGVCAVLALSGLWHVLGRDGPPPPASRIALLSSVPLQWGDADIAAIAQGKGQPDPLIARLSDAGTISFVDSVAQIQAGRPDIALLIQPRALSPDEMVRLDKWVRAGGRLLLFADPALQWPSERKIGDPERPLFTSLLSPLSNIGVSNLPFRWMPKGRWLQQNFQVMTSSSVHPGSGNRWIMLEGMLIVASVQVNMSSNVGQARGRRY